MTTNSTSMTPLEASVEATLSTLRAEAPQRRAQPFTIFRVPAYIRESNRTTYEPRMVSIGPYYHGAAALRAMEDHKWRYLHDLLPRNAAVSSSILIQEVRSLEVRARACYSERPGLGSDDFVRMLLLDGCFILELFFKWHIKEPDALRDVAWGLTLITTDLLLLENQIPFFVVERLYDLVAGAQGGGGGGGRENLVNLLLEHINTEEDPIARPSTACEIHHLLHLYYGSFVPKRPPGAFVAGPARRTAPSAIPCATEMSAAGVTFARRSSPRDMYDVTFDGSRGLMELPAVEVDYVMKWPLLVNLMAFEQSQQPGADEARMLTGYVSLMGMLIRGAQDVSLLRRRGVLANLQADDEEAARFVRRLGDSGGSMNYDVQAFAGLCEEVERYCGSWWHRNRAALRRNYFGSPWSAISFVVAGFVVALTATQTFFTVFPSCSK